MLSDAILIVMLNVIMLSAVMLSVVAPITHTKCHRKGSYNGATTISITTCRIMTFSLIINKIQHSE